MATRRLWLTTGEDLAPRWACSPVSSQNVHERGLPGPGGTHDGHQLPTVEFSRNPFQKGLVSCKKQSTITLQPSRDSSALSGCYQAHSTFAHGAQGKTFHTLYNANFWARKWTSYLFYTSVNVFSCVSWVTCMTFTSWCITLYLECTQHCHVHIQGTRSPPFSFWDEQAGVLWAR